MRDVEQHVHLGQLCPDAVVLDQRLPALHAIAAPLERALVRGGSGAEHARRRVGVRRGEEIDEHLESVADLADDLPVGHEAVLEDELRVVRKALAHLVVHAADRESFELAIDDEAGRAVEERLVRRGLGEQQVDAGAIAVGDETLHSVDAPAAVHLLGLRVKRRVLADEVV